MHRLTGEAFMRGKFLSVSLNSLQNVIFAKEKRLAPTCSSRFALLLPFALFAALAAVSCGGGGNPPPAQFPVANAGGPYFTNVGQSLGFDGSQSTAPTGQSLTYAWDFGDGGTATGIKPAHTYMNSGNFTVKLTVTDTGGATNSASVPVLVVPLPVSNPGGPYSGKVNQAITFNGSASTVPPGQNASYSWNFGDNSTGTGAMPTHAYSTTGVFTVTLTVKDDTGGVGTNSTMATITSGPSAFPLDAKTFLAIRPGHPGFAYIAGPAADGKTFVSANSVDASDGTLSAFEIVNSDSLQPAAGFDLRGIAVDPLSRFLYVYSSDAIVSFAIDRASGALTPRGSTRLTGIIAGAGGELIAFHPSGRFAYLTTRNPNQSDPLLSSAISVCEIDSDSGTLSSIGSFSVQIQNPNSVLIDTTGNFLYISGTEDGDASSASTIAAFRIDPETGALTPIPNSFTSFSSRLHVNTMVADPSGQFVYAAGYSLDTSSAALSVYSMNKITGELTQIAGSPFPVGLAGSNATSLSFDPAGKFAYVLTQTPVNMSDAQLSIQMFALDAVTGIPSSKDSLILPSTSVLNPGASGALALFAGGSSATPSVASIEQLSDGTIAKNSTSQFSLPPNAFLYVTNSGDSGISVLEIDAKTGLLSPAPARISTLMKMPIAPAPR
jgi:PKD repeat protein